MSRNPPWRVKLTGIDNLGVTTVISSFLRCLSQDGRISKVLCQAQRVVMLSTWRARAESLSTAKFAQRAKAVRNAAHVNEDLDQRTLLRRYEGELRRLRAELQQRQRDVVDKRQLLQARACQKEVCRSRGLWYNEQCQAPAPAQPAAASVRRRRPEPAPAGMHIVERAMCVAHDAWAAGNPIAKRKLHPDIALSFCRGVCKASIDRRPYIFQSREAFWPLDSYSAVPRGC